MKSKGLEKATLNVITLIHAAATAACSVGVSTLNGPLNRQLLNLYTAMTNEYFTHFYCTLPTNNGT